MRRRRSESGGFDLALAGVFLLALSIRLIGLGGPIVDEQAWRQTDTAAIARNYFEEGYDLLYPRVDWRGDTEGFVEANFPAYAFLVACGYRLLGAPKEWVGRLVAVLFSAFSVVPLYFLGKRWYGREVGRLSAFLFAIAPLNLFFGRAFMPESMMLFFSIGAIYGFVRWADTETWGWFFCAAICAALAFLIKIPTLYLGLPLAFLAYQKFRRRVLTEPRIWGYVLLSLAPAVLWYRHAYGLFQRTHLTFGIWNTYGYRKWGNVEFLVSPSFYGRMAERLGGVVFTPLGLVLLGFGVWCCLRRRRGWVFLFWLAAIVIYVLLVPEGNWTLNYYQLPFVPAGSVLIGLALASLPKTPLGRAGLLGCLIVLGGSSYLYARPLYRSKPYHVARYEMGRKIDIRLPAGALLVVGDLDANAGARYRAQSPTFLYYCRRKGWQLTPDEFVPERLEALRRKGAQYFVAATRMVYERKPFWDYLKSRYQRAMSDRHFLIVRL